MRKARYLIAPALTAAFALALVCLSGQSIFAADRSSQKLNESEISTSSSYSDSTDGGHAITADGTSAEYKNISVTKTGDASGDEADFYGSNAAVFATNGAALTLSDMLLSSSGAHANGVFSYGAGTTVNVSHSIIKTTGNCSGGIMTTGGGTMNADDVTIETTGNSSAPIRSDRGGGTVTVDGGWFKSSGTGSPIVYSTADITVNGAYMESTASQGVVVEGKNSVQLNDCQLIADNEKVNGSQSSTHQAVMIYQSMSGDASVGKSSFAVSGGSIANANGDIFFVTNTSCEIDLSSAVIANEDASGVFLRAEAAGWGTSGSNGGKADMTATSQTIDGDMVVDGISALNLVLEGGSAFNGAVNASGQAGDVYVELDAGSTWTLSGDSYITSLTCAQGCIDLDGHRLFVNGVEYDGGASTGTPVDTGSSSTEGGGGSEGGGEGTPPDKPGEGSEGSEGGEGGAGGEGGVVDVDYLCFTAEEAGSSVALNWVAETDPAWGQAWKVSRDKTTWTDYTVGNAISLAQAGDKVYWRAKDGGNKTLGQEKAKYYQFSLGGKVAASGSVMTLLDPEDSLRTLKGDGKYCFYNLFLDCTALTSAPDLPATTVASSCYCHMFEGCTALTAAPDLPAEALSPFCYASMFKGCTSLTSMPLMGSGNGIVLGEENCCKSMFEGCSRLVVYNSPGDDRELKLNCSSVTKERATSDMFAGCSDAGDYNTANPAPTTGSFVCYDASSPTGDAVTAFAERLYTVVLGREPDAGGLAVQVAALRGGAQPAEIAYNYFNSPEYFGLGDTHAQSVEKVYGVMFGRASDESGRAFWLAKMDAGQSVRAVVAGFSQAAEYKTYFASCGLDNGEIALFAAHADRAWDGDGALVYSGGNWRDLNAGATGFACRLYGIVLGRAAETAGLNVQSRALQNGMPCWQIAVNFFRSAEYAAKGKSDGDTVVDCYMAILGRSEAEARADAAGRAYWEGRLAREGLESVVKGFCQSDEFEAICRQYGLASGMR